MKSNILYITGLVVISVIAGLATSSCEKVITVDLNTANPTVVIEGNITNKPGPYQVNLMLSTSYFSSTPSPAVSGAMVIMSDDMGVKDTMHEVSAGTYRTSHIQGQTGHTYKLAVLVNGKEYDATSTMPDTVGIQYLTYEFRTGRPSAGDSSGYHIHCHFNDPAGIANYYRAQLYYHDTLQNQANNLTNFQDNLSDGKAINLTLRGQSFRLGDSTHVDLISEDANVFLYFKVLRSIVDAGGPNSTATPQNPPTNFSNGALGYFSAGAVTSMSGVVHL